MSLSDTEGEGEMPLTQQDTQARPACILAITHLTVPDVKVGSTTVTFSQCGPKLIRLLGDRLRAYQPASFVMAAVPQPWPNNNVIFGSLNNPIVTAGQGGYAVSFEIYLESGELGDDSVVLIDLHNQTATGAIAELPTDPDELFTVLIPAFSAAFDKLAGEFATSPRFTQYGWGSRVSAVNGLDASPVTIAAGSAQNVRPGDRFRVMRGDGVFQFVAGIQVAATAGQSSLCGYFGDGNQNAAVGDMVFLYPAESVESKWMPLSRANESLGTRRISGLKQSASGVSLPIELGLSMNFADGASAVAMSLDPPNMVGPPQPGKSFLVQYISVSARIPKGQAVSFMVDGGNAGGHWIQLLPQGTIGGWSVYIGSQLVSFAVAPLGFRTVSAVRSAPEGVGVVDVHFTGTFSD